MKIQIEHIGLYTENLEGMKEFYEKYFRGIANSMYKNSRGFCSYFLTFDGGARLELMQEGDRFEKDTQVRATGYHHMAFSVGSKEAVDELTNQIIQDGYLLLSGPRETGDGYYESCIADPDGNRVEITC